MNLNPLSTTIRLSRISDDGASSTVYRSLSVYDMKIVAEKVVHFNNSKYREQVESEMKILNNLLKESKTINRNKNENDSGRDCIVDLVGIYKSSSSSSSLLSSASASSSSSLSSLTKIKFLGNKENDYSISICLEYMHASLQDVIDFGGCNSMPIISGITYQIVNGINFLHSHRYIHRDIKPANILINSSGLVKIGDFGLCKEFSNDKRSITDSFIGTHTYMSPERLLGESYTYSSDIWSVGLTVLAVVLGCHPFLIPDFKFYNFEKYKTNKKEFYQNDDDDDDDDDDEINKTIFEEFDKSERGIWRIISEIDFEKKKFKKNLFAFPKSFSNPNNKSFDFSNKKMDGTFMNFVNVCCMKEQNLRPSSSILLKHKFLSYFEKNKIENVYKTREFLKKSLEYDTSLTSNINNHFLKFYKSHPNPIKEINNVITALDNSIKKLLQFSKNNGNKFEKNVNNIFIIISKINDLSIIKQLAMDLQVEEKELKNALLKLVAKIKKDLFTH